MIMTRQRSFPDSPQMRRNPSLRHYDFALDKLSFVRRHHNPWIKATWVIV